MLDSAALASTLQLSLVDMAVFRTLQIKASSVPGLFNAAMPYATIPRPRVLTKARSRLIEKPYLTAQNTIWDPVYRFALKSKWFPKSISTV